MKNKINSNEYSLFTNSLLDACSTWVELPTVSWSEVENGTEEYEAGPVKYCHISLTPLYEHVPEPEVEDYNLTGKTTYLGMYEKTIEAPLDLVFNVTSDMAFRHHWMTHIKDSDRLNTKITQNGSAHRCVIKDNESDPYVVIYDFERKNNVNHIQGNRKKDGVHHFIQTYRKRKWTYPFKGGFLHEKKYCQKTIV